jgi:hypothetical protein
MNICYRQIPKYRCDGPSGQAFVTIGGKTFISGRSGHWLAHSTSFAQPSNRLPAQAEACTTRKAGESAPPPPASPAARLARASSWCRG